LGYLLFLQDLIKDIKRALRLPLPTRTTTTYDTTQVKVSAPHSLFIQSKISNLQRLVSFWSFLLARNSISLLRNSISLLFYQTCAFSNKILSHIQSEFISRIRSCAFSKARSYLASDGH